MEKLQKFLKKHLFWEGVACGVLACVWIYGTFIKEGYEQVKIKYDLLEKDSEKKQPLKISITKNNYTLTRWKLKSKTFSRIWKIPKKNSKLWQI